MGCGCGNWNIVYHFDVLHIYHNFSISGQFYHIQSQKLVECVFALRILLLVFLLILLCSFSLIKLFCQEIGRYEKWLLLVNYSSDHISLFENYNSGFIWNKFLICRHFQLANRGLLHKNEDEMCDTNRIYIVLVCVSILYRN